MEPYDALKEIPTSSFEKDVLDFIQSLTETQDTLSSSVVDVDEREETTILPTPLELLNLELVA